MIDVNREILYAIKYSLSNVSNYTVAYDIREPNSSVENVTCLSVYPGDLFIVMKDCVKPVTLFRWTDNKWTKKKRKKKRKEKKASPESNNAL